MQCVMVAVVAGFYMPVVLQAEEQHKITGQVIDADGKPVVGADVATSWSADAGKMHPFNGVQTDKDGKFSLPVEGAFGNAVMVLDKERKTGRLEIFKGKSLTLNFQLEPVVKVHGSVFCKELNKVPPWTTVSVYIRQPGIHARLVQWSPNEKGFVFFLPPGTYQLAAEGSGVESLNKELTLSAEMPDVDLKVLNLEAEVITRLIGKAPPPWNVTAARGVSKDAKLSDFKGK